jgi:hypothetical protein
VWMLAKNGGAGRPPIRCPDQGRVGGGRGGCRSRESLLPAAFACLPVPQSRPWLRFPPPLIEPDVRISRIRLSDGLHERACAGLCRRRICWMSTTPIFPYTSAYPTPWPELNTRLNRLLTGWAQYFSFDFTGQADAAIRWHVTERVRRFLCRRHKLRVSGTSRFQVPADSRWRRIFAA